MKIHELLETAADSFNQTAQGTSKVANPNKFSKIKNFAQNVKQGYKKASDFQQDLPYTNLGKAARGIGNFVKTINKGPTR